MIEITSQNGEQYSFDPETERIFKDGYLLPTSQAEPCYVNNKESGKPPRFSGIILKEKSVILTRSGKENPITDPDTI